MTQPEALPPLPNPLYVEPYGNSSRAVYSEAQMRAYARAALEAQGAPDDGWSPNPKRCRAVSVNVSRSQCVLDAGHEDRHCNRFLDEFDATPQAAIGAEPPAFDLQAEEARRYRWLVQTCHPDNLRKLFNGCPYAAPVGVPAPSSWLGSIPAEESDAEFARQVAEMDGHQAQAVASSPEAAGDISMESLNQFLGREHETESDSSAVQRPADEDRADAQIYSDEDLRFFRRNPMGG